MSDNWVVQNLQNALDTWNSKLSEIWQLLTTSPQEFKGGTIWNVMVNINGAVQAIGFALLVLFFVVGVVRTCGSFTEVKKPEHALKLFIRFARAYACFIQYCSRYDFYHYELSRFWQTKSNHITFGNDNHNRRMWILGEYSSVGGNAYRRSFYNRIVFYYDNDRVRKIF